MCTVWAKTCTYPKNVFYPTVQKDVFLSQNTLVLITIRRRYTFCIHVYVFQMPLCKNNFSNRETEICFIDMSKISSTHFVLLFIPIYYMVPCLKSQSDSALKPRGKVSFVHAKQQTLVFLLKFVSCV